MVKVISIVTLFILFVSMSMIPEECQAQVSLLGPPTVGSLLGESIAQKIFDQARSQIKEDIKNSYGIVGYEKALKKYEKKLKKLEKKYRKARAKEEKQLQRLIDDMMTYTPGDPDVNRKQEEKQKKAYEFARKCQEKDKQRAAELKKFHEENCPKLEEFYKTF